MILIACYARFIKVVMQDRVEFSKSYYNVRSTISLTQQADAHSLVTQLGKQTSEKKAEDRYDGLPEERRHKMREMSEKRVISKKWAERSMIERGWVGNT